MRMRLLDLATRAGILHLAALAGLSWVAAGCGSTPRTVAGPEEQASPERGVPAAALPYEILRARGGQELSEAELLGELSRTRAVCIGESHPNPHHHWAQLTLLERLLDQNQAAGVDTALGMEMFQRPFQGVLDDYAAGRIDDAALLARSGWEQRWGYDWALYSPMVHLAVARGAALLALNLENELRRKVSSDGFESLSPADREKIPEMDLHDQGHRAWWDDVMASLGGGHPVAHGKSGEASDGEEPSEEEEAERRERAERMYSIQVLWDETMADTAAAWLSAGARRQVVILAGNGHCHDSGIVTRLARRGAEPAVSIRPHIDTGDGGLAALLARPENDYLFVMRLPAR